MKVILNNSLLEIASQTIENRHKMVYPAIIDESGIWTVRDDTRSGYFIDIKQGDIIHIEKNDIVSYAVIAFTATNAEPVNGSAVDFANGTSARIRQATINNTAIEDCYMFVMTKYITNNLEPKLIQINGMTLNEDGYLL